TELEFLGIPRSWWFVHQGLHPFSPERTLIIPDRPQENMNTSSLAQTVMHHLANDAAPHSEDGIFKIIHAAAVLTQTYGIPDQLEVWSTRMAHWLFHFYSFAAHDHLWISP